MRPDQWLVDGYEQWTDELRQRIAELENQNYTLTDALETTIVQRDAWQKEAIALKREATRHEV